MIAHLLRWWRRLWADPVDPQVETSGTDGDPWPPVVSDSPDRW